MLSETTANAILSEISALRPEASEPRFFEKCVEILSGYLHCHVSLYLIEGQVAVLKGATGPFGEFLLSRGHQFQLDDNSLVSAVVRSGAIWAVHGGYDEPYSWGETYRVPLPLQVDPGVKLSLQLVNKTLTNWKFMSVPPTPPGWEIHFPLRLLQQVYGVLHIQAQDFSKFTLEQVTKWWPDWDKWDKVKEFTPFPGKDVSVLQGLADQLSRVIKSSNFTTKNP